MSEYVNKQLNFKHRILKKTKLLIFLLLIGVSIPIITVLANDDDNGDEEGSEFGESFGAGAVG